MNPQRPKNGGRAANMLLALFARPEEIETAEHEEVSWCGVYSGRLMVLVVSSAWTGKGDSENNRISPVT